MMYTHRTAALSFLSVTSLVHALPDFSCICESKNLNGCSQSYSCRLNSTIDFYKASVPAWVTDAEEALFLNTIDDAVNGLLRPPFFSLGRMTWESSVACDDGSGSGSLRWHAQLSQCLGSSNSMSAGNSTEPPRRRRYHGWASLGFHPLGNRAGTWLTQILGQIADAGEDDLSRARCAETGLYVSVDYINASEPYDPRFSPRGGWGNLYDHVYPVGSQGVPSYRTDGDLIENGVDLNCTGYDTSGPRCEQPHCYEPANVTHFDCPAGRTGAIVRVENCSRLYSPEDVSKAAGGKSVGSVLLPLCAAVMFAWWFGMVM